MQNDTLLAIPFFTFMGIVLERSGMAEDLLETVGQVFGPVRGGLAIAVVLVGALLAATTGRGGRSRDHQHGADLAAHHAALWLQPRPWPAAPSPPRGTLAQAIPPSFGADRAGRSARPLGWRYVCGGPGAWPAASGPATWSSLPSMAHACKSGLGAGAAAGGAHIQASPMARSGLSLAGRFAAAHAALAGWAWAQQHEPRAAQAIQWLERT